MMKSTGPAWPKKGEEVKKTKLYNGENKTGKAISKPNFLGKLNVKWDDGTVSTENITNLCNCMCTRYRYD